MDSVDPCEFMNLRSVVKRMDCVISEQTVEIERLKADIESLQLQVSLSIERYPNEH